MTDTKKGRVLKVIREETGAPIQEAKRLLDSIWTELTIAGQEAKAAEVAGPIRELLSDLREAGHDEESLRIAIFQALNSDKG